MKAGAASFYDQARRGTGMCQWENDRDSTPVVRRSIRNPCGCEWVRRVPSTCLALFVESGPLRRLHCVDESGRLLARFLKVTLEGVGDPLKSAGASTVASRHCSQS